MAVLSERLAAYGQHVSYQRFALTELPDHIMLSLKDEGSGRGNQSLSEFGYLRSHMKACLEGLLSRPDVEFEAVAPTIALRDIISGAKKPSDATVRVDINIYGPRGPVSKTIGRMLSRNRLYLQTPEAARPHMAYHNPQRITFSGREGGNLGRASEPVGDVVSVPDADRQRMSTLMNGVYAALENESFRSTSLSQPTKSDPLPYVLSLSVVPLAAVNPSPVVADRARHQEEALGFMLDRESGRTDDVSDIWRETEEDDQKW
jgi:hypothetical protein